MNYTQNIKIEQVKEETLVVGIDIGSTTHYARAFDYRGREIMKIVIDGRYSIPYTPNCVFAEIRDLVYSRDRIMKQHNIVANRI